ncbi:hypothetical protein A2310_05590 [candidate division WOR-1 bacterium RIFOXYB2_FULL_37_13]|uniref:Colicin V production protein n=1 Tax=candidate division WOR-1 bacterium RIFOXYB2_FULL_37_13 TaxID=1802579 RepID=A0A1F4SU85_UNCSA|nr:MAG: hypothetical protein A2310_05590 [candidate division WOR-1 bacterium RIFOXYB2_FULL_37_13]
MNSIDIFLSCLGLLFLIIGLRAGLLSTILSILAMYFSLTVASNFAGEATNALSKIGLLDNELSKIIIILTIFLALTAVFEFVFWVIKKIITVIVLGPFDKVGGMILGFARGLLLGSILLMVVGVFPLLQNLEKEREHSQLFIFTKNVMEFTLPQAKTATDTLTKSISGKIPKIKTDIKIPFNTEEITSITSKAAENINKVKRLTP